MDQFKKSRYLVRIGKKIRVTWNSQYLFTIIQFSCSLQMVALSWTSHFLLHLWRRRRRNHNSRSVEEGTWFHRFDYTSTNSDPFFNREVLGFFFRFVFSIQYFSDLRTRFFQSFANYAPIESFSSTTLPISYKTIRTKTVLSSKGTVFALLFSEEITLANSHVKYHLVGIFSRFLLDFFSLFRFLSAKWNSS